MGSKDLTLRVYYRVHSKKMAMSVLSGHRDELVGCFFSKDGDSAYSVACDGAIFVWNFEYGERIPLVDGKVGRRSQEDLKMKKKARKNKKKNQGLAASFDSDDNDEVIGSSDEEDNKEDDSSEGVGGGEGNSGGNGRGGKENMLTKRGGKWQLVKREFLWEQHTSVTSTAFNKKSNLLVVGFNKGVFGLYEMPSCTNIHRLSVSHHSLNTASINCSGV
jgi:periodic tryptophan protein 2